MKQECCQRDTEKETHFENEKLNKSNEENQWKTLPIDRVKQKMECWGLEYEID